MKFMHNLKIGFAGTPEFSAKILQKLLDEKCNITCIYTQPDRPQGRGRKVMPSPVKSIAAAHNIPIEQPNSLKKDPALSSIKKYDLDVLIVVAYGLILPQAFLDAPKYGSINIHASLLPKWRGAAPIQRAILNGDKKTGITIMQMDAGLDTGDMLISQECDILPEDTTESLSEKLNIIAQHLIVTTLNNLPLKGEKQDSAQATYAEKIQKSEAIINWNDTATNIINQIHAFNPWPVAHALIDDKSIKIFKAQASENKSKLQPGSIVEVTHAGIVVATGSDDIVISQIQFPGKNKILNYDIYNSYKDFFKNHDFC